MLINGKEFDFSKITIIAAGRDIIGLRGIKYKRSKDKEHLHGKGNEPLSIQSGNVTYDGSMSVTQSEYLGLKQLGGGSILDLNIDIAVVYGDRGLALETDILYGVEFTEEETGWGQGDKSTTIELPFLYIRQG
ncbi:MAG: hypothetical protein LBO06_02460 [Bacteroidales bacterium]|jgi:hypothetical protein|nr:hypothetical protein [Bacteroidales bacterium]